MELLLTYLCNMLNLRDLSFVKVVVSTPNDYDQYLKFPGIYIIYLHTLRRIFVMKCQLVFPFWGGVGRNAVNLCFIEIVSSSALTLIWNGHRNTQYKRLIGIIRRFSNFLVNNLCHILKNINWIEFHEWLHNAVLNVYI